MHNNRDEPNMAVEIPSKKHSYTCERKSRYRYSWSLQADEGFDDLDGRTMGYCTASCNYILADLWGRLWTIIGVLVWK